jgi:hypothetical protein
MRPGLVRHVVRSSFVAAALVCAASSAYGEEGNRLFGFLPNSTTVDEHPTDEADVPPLSVKHSFKLADLNSFDPVVFPFVGLKTVFGAGGSDPNFAARYGRAFANHTTASFMTIAIMPAVTKQDPRYFRAGEGNVFRRMAYAASRSIVTRTASGSSTFNYSRVGGNLAAASLSNLYYEPSDRTVSGTMSRWGTLVIWNALTNEAREFWPDIRAKLRKP